MNETSSFQAKQLYNEKNYIKIIELYKFLDEKSFCQWDYYYYSVSFWKLGNYREGHRISRNGLLKFRDFMALRAPYCWCLYYLYVRDFPNDNNSEKNFIRAVDSIVRCSEQRPYTPYELSLWKIISYFKGKPGSYAEQIDKYLSLLNPSILSDIPKRISLQGKDREIESDREKWYSLKSNILIQKKDYRTCISICKEALNLISKLHHDNDIWFRYRIATSEFKLGNDEEAEKQLKKILITKEHWIIYNGLFDIYRKQGKSELALKFACKAMLAQGEYKSKVNLLENISDFLLETSGMDEASYWHILLAKSLRVENNWRVTQELNKKVDCFQFETVDTKKLINNLLKFWKKNRNRGEVLYEGTINIILPNKKDGFIKCIDGNTYYFRGNSVNYKGYGCNQKVTFYFKDGFDKKKQRPTKQAYDISLIE